VQRRAMELEAALHGRENELAAAAAAATKARAEREREQEMERARKSEMEAGQARAAEEKLRLTEEANGDCETAVLSTILQSNLLGLLLVASGAVMILGPGLGPAQQQPYHAKAYLMPQCSRASSLRK
jgi:hypothetical protein